MGIIIYHTFEIKMCVIYNMVHTKVKRSKYKSRKKKTKTPKRPLKGTIKRNYKGGVHKKYRTKRKYTPKGKSTPKRKSSTKMKGGEPLITMLLLSKLLMAGAINAGLSIYHKNQIIKRYSSIMKNRETLTNEMKKTTDITKQPTHYMEQIRKDFMVVIEGGGYSVDYDTLSCMLCLYIPYTNLSNTTYDPKQGNTIPGKPDLNADKWIVYIYSQEYMIYKILTAYDHLKKKYSSHPMCIFIDGMLNDRDKICRWVNADTSDERTLRYMKKINKKVIQLEKARKDLEDEGNDPDPAIAPIAPAIAPTPAIATTPKAIATAPTAEDLSTKPVEAVEAVAIGAVEAVESVQGYDATVPHESNLNKAVEMWKEIVNTDVSKNVSEETYNKILLHLAGKGLIQLG
jgi:hypothetical protein